MNLANSIHLSKSMKIIKNNSMGRISRFDTSNCKYKETNQPDQLEIVSILIKLNKNDELQPEFVDAFSKFVINNSNFDFNERYGDIRETTYLEFYETLKNLRNQTNRSQCLKESHEGFKKTRSYQSVLRSTVDILPQTQRKKYLFRFQAYNNSIIILLDLSPYMLLYDYSTKSFALQNMEQIIRDLFNGLQHHYNERKSGDTGPSYFISCYAFSVYNKQIQEIMKEQEIFFVDSHETKFKNKDLISDYICAYINRSELPHKPITEKNPVSISKIIQKILNIQQGHSGIKSIVTISSFKQLDTTPYIFFSSNWYTYSFICAGELNFGSFLIDDSEIANRFSKNPYFETKFVYKCKFLENWEKVDLIQKEGMKFKYMDLSVKKNRAILYLTRNGQIKQTIFDDILEFKLKLYEKRRKIEGTHKSNQSNISGIKNPKYFSQYEFNISAEHIADIMRTKYLQGWQQQSTENYPQNTRYLFKLEFSNKIGILYKATKKSNHFNIQIHYTMGETTSAIEQQKAKIQRNEIRDAIKKIDLINTSNFDIVTAFKNNNTSQIGSKIKIKDRGYNYCCNFDERGYEGMNMLKQLLAKHDQWNCYFKVRKIYIHFTPNSHFMNDLSQLLNEFGYLLGQRISHLCFMQRKEIKKIIFDDIKEKQISKWNIIFVKISGILHFLEFKFGFLKFNENQIRQIMENIENKLATKKLISGSIKIIPQEVYSYCTQHFNPTNILRKSLPSVFEKTWKVKFKNGHLGRLFKHLNKKMLKKLGYNYLCSKGNNKHYFKIINFTEKENKKQKGVFLQVKYENDNQGEFKLQVFPSFDMIQNLMAQQNSPELSGLNFKNGTSQITQKSISSSSHFSISSNSLPLPLVNTSDKQISFPKTTASQNQSNKYKNSFLELFSLFIDELKQSQKRLLNLLKCYTQIYQCLLKKYLDDKRIRLQNQVLRQKIKQIYHFNENFNTEFLFTLEYIKKEYYKDEFHFQQEINKNAVNRRSAAKATAHQNSCSCLQQINIDDIPEPREYLMESPISNIKGDFTIYSKACLEKKYTFFLITPNRVVYLWKSMLSNRIYYRCMPNLYSNFSIERQEAALKDLIEKELIFKVNKQVKDEQYLTFYNLISEEPSILPNSNSKTALFYERKVFKDLSFYETLKNSEQIIKGFPAVTLNCNEIFTIISNEQNKIIEPRIIKVLGQFRKKFFEYIHIFYEQCHIELINKSKKTPQSFLFNKTKSQQLMQTSLLQSQQQIRTLIQKFSQQEGLLENMQEQKKDECPKFSNYYYEKKSPILDQTMNECIKISNVEQYNQFYNSILKIITNNGTAINEKNFMNLFINHNSNTQNYFNEIQILCFGHKIDKNSSKIKLLREILNQLLTQCVIYLNIITVTEPHHIKQMEEKLSNYIVRIPTVKVPDKLWVQPLIMRQIQSGQMRSIIPFHQYSFKPLPAKYIARELQIVPPSFTPLNKPNHIFNLKYWLTLEITPVKTLKIKMIPFRHITLSTEIILKMSKGSYESQMHEIIDFYVAQFFKFLKIRNIFKTIEDTLMFPLDPPIPIYINQQIYKKIEKEKMTISKPKANKKSKFKNITTTSTNNLIASVLESTPTLEQILNNKDMFKMPLIYQGEISYYPKFEPQQFFNKLAICVKLNPYVIRNLENTFIFFNPELKEYSIFYLDKNSNVENQFGSKDLGSSQQYDFERSKRYTQPSFNFRDSFSIQKKKNNVIKYYVYCIDNTVPKDSLQKFHGGLIRKAIQEITFFKIAKHLDMNPSLIDEAEQEYFNGGERGTYSQKIPYIEQTGNLRQYLKQHLQNVFYHRRTELKSELKQKQALIKREQDEETTSSRKNKISSKKMIKKNSIQCDRRCNPQTWIFNTVQNPKLQQVLGKCMFLLKINITSNQKTAQNALFWHRNIKDNAEVTYIYPYMNGKQGQWLIETQGQDESPYNEHSLYSYLTLFTDKEYRQKKKGLDFGKSQHHRRSALHNKFTLEEFPMLSKENSITSHIKRNGESLQNNLVDTQFKLGEKYSIITFQIISYLGYPRFKVLQNIYREFIFQSVYEYFLENRLFRELFANFNLQSITPKPHKNSGCFVKNKTSVRDQIKQRYSQNLKEKQENDEIVKMTTLCRIQSSPIKTSSNTKLPFALLITDDFLNTIYTSLLTFFNSLTKQLTVQNTQCITIFQTINKLVIEQKLSVLFDFINNFINTFAGNKVMQNYTLHFIIYGIDKITSTPIFWSLEFDKFDKQEKFCGIRDEIQNHIMRYNLQFSKMGVFFTDFLHDISSVRETFFKKDQQRRKQGQNYHCRDWQTCNRTQTKLNIDFEWMKRYGQNRSFCQAEYLFKRSLIMHHEIGDNQLVLYSYNFKQAELEHIISRLEELQFWFAEKNRLYNFILKIKKNERENDCIQYEVPSPSEPNPNRKSYLEEMKISDKENKPVHRNRAHSIPADLHENEINLTKLLKSLVFDELPIKGFANSRASLEKMYSILSHKTVDYDNYPEYRGKERSKLAKIGREYLSILRFEYGYEKIIHRKQSQVLIQGQKRI